MKLRLCQSDPAVTAGLFALDQDFERTKNANHEYRQPDQVFKHVAPRVRRENMIDDSSAEPDAEAEDRTADPTVSPQENPDRLRQATGFQPISPPSKAAAPHPRPSDAPDTQDRAPSSLSARIPGQKRYGAPQYPWHQAAFQYLPGIKKRDQKYWTPHFPAAYKSVP